MEFSKKEDGAQRETNAQEEVVHYKSAKSGKICGEKRLRSYAFKIKEGKRNLYRNSYFRRIMSHHSIRKTELIVGKGVILQKEYLNTSLQFIICFIYSHKKYFLRTLSATRPQTELLGNQLKVNIHPDPGFIVWCSHHLI